MSAVLAMAINNEKVVFFVVAGGLLIAGLISLVVISSIVYCAIVFGDVPEVLSNYGGIIIGFFFGQFFMFSKKVMGHEQENQENRPIRE
jgi:hypothetical protein